MFLCIPCTCQNEQQQKSGKKVQGNENSFYESNIRDMKKASQSGKKKSSKKQKHEMDDEEDDELNSEEIDNIIESERQNKIQSVKEEKINLEKVELQQKAQSQQTQYQTAQKEQLLKLLESDDSEDSVHSSQFVKQQTGTTKPSLCLKGENEANNIEDHKQEIWNEENEKQKNEKNNEIKRNNSVQQAKPSDLLKTMYLIKKLELNKAIKKLEPSIEMDESFSKEQSQNNLSLSKVNKSEIKESNIIEQFKLSIKKLENNDGTTEMQKDPHSLQAYKLLRVIGKARYGKLYLASLKYNPGEYYTIKAIGLGKMQSVSGLKEEVQFEQKLYEEMMDAGSPFFPNQIALLSNKQKLFSITEFMPGGELFFQLRKKGKFTEEEVRCLATELVVALEQLHAKSIVLRALSPENIMLDANGHIKIFDLSLARYTYQLSKGMQNSFSAKSEYLAPEILLNKTYGLSSDWWSLGIVLYELLAGKPPYFSPNRQQTFVDLLTKELPIPYYFSKETSTFLKGLLKVDEKHRLGFKGSQQIKSNRFFRDVNWKKVEKAQAIMAFVPIKDLSQSNILVNCDQSIIANEKLTNSSYGSEDETYKEFLPFSAFYNIKPTFVVEEM